VGVGVLPVVWSLETNENCEEAVDKRPIENSFAIKIPFLPTYIIEKNKNKLQGKELIKN